MRTMLTVVLGIIAVVLLTVVVVLFQNPKGTSLPKLSLTQYLAVQNRVRSATIRGDEVTASDDTGKQFTTNVPSGSAEATRLAERGADVTLLPTNPDSTVAGYAVVAFNGLWLVAALWTFNRIARALEKLSGRGQPSTAGPGSGARL